MTSPSCHHLVGRAILEALPGPVVEFVGGVAWPFIGDHVEVHAFGEVLPQQAVGRSYVCQVAEMAVWSRVAASIRR
jgi:hypothetical protein